MPQQKPPKKGGKGGWYSKLSSTDKAEKGRDKIHPEDEEKQKSTGCSGCNDVVFAILFIAQMIFMIVFGITRGIPEAEIAHEQGALVEKSQKQFLKKADEDEIEKGSNAVSVGLSVAIFVLAMSFSFLFFRFALRFPERLIKFGLYGSAFIVLIMIVVSAICGSIIGALLWTLMLVLVIFFIRAVRERIPFAAANLNCAVHAVRKYPNTGTVAAGVMIFQALWILICILAIMGFALKNIRLRQAQLPGGSVEYEILAKDAVYDGSGYSSNKKLPSMNNGKDIEYYGLFPGCKNIFVVVDDIGHEAGDDDDDYGIQTAPACACAMGKYVTEGVCNSTDFMKTEMASYAVVYLLFILCVFWGGKVLNGIVHVTCSGAVAHWWFGDAAYAGTAEVIGVSTANNGPGDMQEAKEVKQSSRGSSNVVRASLNRALGPSFGSICFGSLIVALLSTLEVLVKSTQDSFAGPDGNGMCAACLSCVNFMIKCVRDMMEYFNRWAFTYVAIYGDSFMQSGKAVSALFKRRGWSSVISDTLCSTALFLATVMIAVIVGIVAALLGLALGAAAGKVAVIAVIAAYLMCSCITAVLDAAVLTIIVCFAEDPHAGNENHPDEFAAMYVCWQAFYGDELEEAGYDRLF